MDKEEYLKFGIGLKEENCQVLRAKPDSLCVIFGGMLCLNYFAE